MLYTFVDQAEFLAGEETSRSQIFGRDFLSFWMASLLAQTDRMAEIFDPIAFNAALSAFMGMDLAFNPFPYPPNALWFVLPLSAIPYYWSFWVWMVLGLGAYLLVSAGGGSSLARVLLLLAAPATLINFSMGQNGFLTAVLFLGGLKLLERRPLLAGILFGALTFKPQLGLLIPIVLLAGRHWSTFMAAVITTVGVLAWSLWFVGIDAWRDYLTVGVPAQRDLMETGSGWFLSMMPTPFAAARLLDFGISAGYVVQGLSALGAAIGVGWAYYKGGDPRLLIVVVLSGTFLASPYVLSYDLVLLSVAVVYLTEHGLKNGFLLGERLILGLAWLLPILTTSTKSVGFPVGPTVLFLLFAVALYRLHLSCGRSPKSLPEQRTIRS